MRTLMTTDVHRHATHQDPDGPAGACPTVCGLPCGDVPRDRLVFTGGDDAAVTCARCLAGKGGHAWQVTR